MSSTVPSQSVNARHRDSEMAATPTTFFRRIPNAPAEGQVPYISESLIHASNGAAAWFRLKRSGPNENGPDANIRAVASVDRGWAYWQARHSS